MKQCFEHYRTLRKEMDAWLDQSHRMDPPSKHGGGEDEANYSLAWFPHYLITGNDGVREHFEHLRDMLAGWVERDCLHGYEPEAEAHHGTEPFLLFLPRYLGLFPEDEKANALLQDAAEHIGNWVEGIPEWFDWERNRFYGYYIGTRTVGRDDGFDTEIAEHFRFVHIALAAHRMTGQDRYLDWALQYGKRRAEMIVAIPDGPLPIAWDANGQPRFGKQATGQQKKAAQAGHHVPGDPLIGVEVLLASGVIYALGDLFEASGDAVFHQAARRIAEPMVNELLDPYSDPGAAAISYFRQQFSDPSLDDAIRAQIARFPDMQEGELAMVFPQARRRDWPGVGKRNDMTYWGIWNSDGSVTPTTEPSTAALTLAYQVTGDEDYAERALKQAADKLTMARRVLRGGREHADMGGAICSTAAGHGRNWGIGSVTGCYGPLLLGTREVKSKVTPTVEVKYANGERGIPHQILPLVIHSGTDVDGVMFYNGGDSDISFSWRFEDNGWQILTVEAGEVVDMELTGVMA